MCHKQSDRAAHFRAKTLHRIEAGDPRAHGAHNAPSTQTRSEGHGRLTRKDNPKGHVESIAKMAFGEQQIRQ